MILNAGTAERCSVGALITYLFHLDKNVPALAQDGNAFIVNVLVKFLCNGSRWRNSVVSMRIMLVNSYFAPGCREEQGP